TEDDFFFFFASRRRHTRFSRDWSSDVCSSDLEAVTAGEELGLVAVLSDEADRFLGRTGPDVLELGGDHVLAPFVAVWMAVQTLRSEERRVGKGWNWRRSPSRVHHRGPRGRQLN